MRHRSYMRLRALWRARIPSFRALPGYIFLFAGLLALGYCIATLTKARVSQNGQMRSFIEDRDSGRSAAVPEIPSESRSEVKPAYPSLGSTVALMVIPRLGLSTIVIEGAGERELKLGPGHIRSTALPGQGGNFGIAGHRDSFFRPLRNIRAGDLIQVATKARERHYQVVTTQIVDPTNVSVLYPTEHEALTLVTCYPFNFIGAAPKRFVVRADCFDCENSFH